MKNTMVLVVGASGSGKTNLINRTFKHSQILRSTTSRAMRPNEKQGQNYLFVTKKEFETKRQNHELIQFAEYDNEYYGVTKTEVKTKFFNNKIAVIAVVMSSVSDFQKYCDAEDIRCIPVFCDISKRQLLKHFDNRPESDVQKKNRIAKYEKEILNCQYFDEQHILDMNPNDFGTAASKKLLKLIYQ